MSGTYFLGIDIGTYESKGVIADESGNLVSQATIAHELSLPKPGWVEHDADKIWWHDFCWLSNKLTRERDIPARQIAGVGCSGIGPDLLPLDESGKPLRPAILYGIDTRAAKEIADLETRIGREKIIETCGNGLSTQSVGPKILWLARNEPEIYKQTRHILTATGYLVFRLTGKTFIDHYTAATFAPLYNIHTLAWEPELCEGIVDLELLPIPAWSHQLAGYVTREASFQTGLTEGTPVIVGTTDAAAESVSVGVTSPGELMIMYGTTLFMINVVDHLIVDPRLWAGTYLAEGTWSLAAGMATSGALTRWFRNEFAAKELEIETQGGTNAYAALSKMAAKISPGSDGLIVLPYFSGERTPIHDPLARGVIAGLTLSHTRAHLYRALLEGVAYGIRHNLDVVGERGGTSQLAIAVGGGTKSDVWLQIVSDVTGIQQNVPELVIGAAYGDAYLSALGTGYFVHLDGVKAWVKPRKTIYPNLENHEIYSRYYEHYREMYPSIKDDLHSLAKLGMRQSE
jgi:xylulokinase